MTITRGPSALYPSLRIKRKMRHGLFPQDDISERNSTESRSDLSFEGLRPELMVECIACLKETACPELVEATSQTLKAQITATGPYRYHLEGMVRASSHIKTIQCSIKNPENAQRAHSPRLKGGNIASELQ
jgi:hypothetical protein